MAEDNDQEEPAGEKTEAPTQRRIQKAAEQGQVALSREAVSFSALLFGAMGGALALPAALDGLRGALAGTLARAHEIETGWALGAWFWIGLGLALPVGIGASLGAVAATLAQTRGAMSVQSIAPSLQKISPIAGFGRLFGAEGWLEFLRTLIKIGVIGAALWIAAGDMPALVAALAQPGALLLSEVGWATLRLLGVALAAFALLAIGDILLSRFRHFERLRMTRQELREEYKETEGNPEVKAKLRQIREAKGRRRMMAAVPDATVIVTNPTHYAVALRYEPGHSAAPKVVAKGADAMAARIREVAKEHNVPILSDPPLARALYRVELDAEIPAEHWDAAARIIAFVMRGRGPAPQAERAP